MMYSSCLRCALWINRGCCTMCCTWVSTICTSLVLRTRNGLSLSLSLSLSSLISKTTDLTHDCVIVGACNILSRRRYDLCTYCTQSSGPYGTCTTIDSPKPGNTLSVMEMRYLHLMSIFIKSTRKSTPFISNDVWICSSISICV